jgi:hypothetical protein
MHGKPHTTTWTSLSDPAVAGDSFIYVQGDPDWEEDDVIVIASTHLGVEDNEVPGVGDNSEQRTIDSIENVETTTDGLGRTKINLKTALAYDHMAVIEQYGDTSTHPDDWIDMRAEVGLLSHNVKFQGDWETTEDNQYGATIMMHSPGDETVIGRIQDCEFSNVGQAFQLGRYPIHYHMIGEVTKSYVKRNSIHNSFNRGTTIHAVYYLEVSYNVYYHIKGHNVFIEDGVERHNYVAYNLVVASRASHSILNTDTTPASFWITNPDNIWVGNHAAGGPRYGFWFDLQDNSIGPSASATVCPINEKLGEFRDNVAHSMGRYGLRIFHKH